MTKTWDITMEGEESGVGDDITLIFADSEEIIGEATLNKRFVEALEWNIKNKPHYKAIRNVKSIKSSTGDELNIKDVGVILASVASEELKIGLLFVTETKKGGYKIIGLWPDEFARVCKRKRDIYGKMVVNLVQNPAFWQEVSVIFH